MDQGPSTFSLRSAMDHGDGGSTLRLEQSSAHGDALRELLSVGGDVAVVARRNVQLKSVVEGIACTHHRVVQYSDAAAGPVLRVEPKVPPHSWRNVVLVPVAACAEYVGRDAARERAVVPLSASNVAAGNRYKVTRPRARPTPQPALPKRRGPGPWVRLRKRFASTKPRNPGPPAYLVLWDAALAEHDRIATAYLQVEMDPEQVLRYPAITDVRVPETAAFQDALGRAQALRTETGPTGADHADSYHAAVLDAGRAWEVCATTARRLGHSVVEPADAADLDKAIKLIVHARGADNDFERSTYLDRAQSLIDDLLSRTQLSLTPTARSQLASVKSAPALSPGASSRIDAREHPAPGPDR